MHPKCHNAEPGTFGHECGKPAVYAGKWPFEGMAIRNEPYFVSSFCADCKEHGYERKGALEWQLIDGDKVTFSDGIEWKLVDIGYEYVVFATKLSC